MPRAPSSFETPPAVRIVADIGGKNLQCDAQLKPQIFRDIDGRPCRPAAKRGDDLVLVQPGAGRKETSEREKLI